jgi:tRNA-binding protein
MEIEYDEFQKIDIRCGTIIDARNFDRALKPSIQLEIDFGSLGIKKSSAQITEQYTPSDLLGKQVIAVMNLPQKQIANFFSECLVLGVCESNRGVTLIVTSKIVNNGAIVR